MSKNKKSKGEENSKAEKEKLFAENLRFLRKKAYWESNYFPEAVKEPQLTIPEGVFLPTAVRILADTMFGPYKRDDREEYKKCVILIATRVRENKLQAFRIGQLCHEKEPVPDSLFAQPEIETMFMDGQTEILKSDLAQGFEIYFVYLNRKQFEKLINSIRTPKLRVNKATIEERKKAEKEIKEKCLREGTILDLALIRKEFDIRLGKGRVTKRDAEKALAGMPQQIRRGVGKRGKAKPQK